MHSIWSLGKDGFSPRAGGRGRMRGVWFVWVCVRVSGLHAPVCVVAWLFVVSSPLSWAILQVSWELGCFCLWFDPGRGEPSLRTCSLSSPRKHLCVMSRPPPRPPARRVYKEEESLFFSVLAGRGCPPEQTISSKCSH